MDTFNDEPQATACFIAADASGLSLNKILLPRCSLADADSPLHASIEMIMNTKWSKLKHASLADIIGWAEAQPWCQAMADCDQDAEWHTEANAWPMARSVFRLQCSD